jgi:drug/metabolite transporter (DMT)-like permease
MAVEIFILVLLSASLHPFRDLLLKGLYAPGLCYLSISLTWMIFAIIQALIVGAPLMISLDYLPYVFGSSAGLYAYYYGTLLALKKGDLSVYYPIIRSSPVFVVVVGWTFLDRSYSSGLLAGIAIVLIGVFLIQRSGHKQVKLLAQPLVFALALIAMSGSGIYSLSDAYAMQAAETAGMPDLDVSTFLLWVYAVLSIGFWVTFSIQTHSYMPLGKQIGVLWKRHPWKILSAAALSYASYVLILFAYEKGANVAVVTSLRLLSIPLTVLLSAFYLKESTVAKRLAASGVIVGGIMIILLVG